MSDIYINNISKRFDGRIVLSDFSCVIKSGSTTVLMGESGCGKTTLANIILGIFKPDSGEVIGMPARISAVFQENRLCEGFDAVANLELVMHGKEQGVNAMDAKEILTSLGLGSDLHKKVSELSGGMRRRVAIARAIAADADFVLLDEPFRELDGATRTMTARYTHNMLSGKTVFLITHDGTDAALFNAETVYMR